MPLDTGSRSTNNNKMMTAQAFDGYQELISESIKIAENQPVASPIVDRFMHQHTITETTLSVAVASGGSTYQITVADATGFAVGDYLHIGNGATEITHPRITVIVGTLFTLDRRLDLSHAIGTPVIKAIVDMALTGQTGTLAAPQEYYVQPDNDDVWYITRILFSMVHGTAGDLGLFGNLPALTNGVVLRVRSNGVYYTYTNWKINADMKSDMFDVEFDPRSGGQGNYGTSGRGTFTTSGSVVRLDGSTNDRIELYIQDDITALGSFTMKAQGRREI